MSFWAGLVLGLSALMQSMSGSQIKEWARERLLKQTHLATVLVEMVWRWIFLSSHVIWHGMSFVCVYRMQACMILEIYS